MNLNNFLELVKVKKCIEVLDKYIIFAETITLLRTFLSRLLYKFPNKNRLREPVFLIWVAI